MYSRHHTLKCLWNFNQSQHGRQLNDIMTLRKISSGEVFTALKPFFFAVHPDLFGQFPKERAVNENSLKQLNAYIESTTQHMHDVNSQQRTSLTFYLRKGNGIEQPGATTTRMTSNPPSFQTVSIDLGHKDVRRTVHSILQKCNLPTSYIDSIPSTAPKSPIHTTWMNEGQGYSSQTQYWNNTDNYKAAQEDITRQKSFQDDLKTWLDKNVHESRQRVFDTLSVREEILKLQKSICEYVGINEISWNCGWSPRHFRGCLQSFSALIGHHLEIVELLKGKNVIFGRESGVSLDAHIILNSGEVRANWLNVIKNAKKYEQLLLRIPSVEKALSRALRDINVVHRKFQPTRLVETYELNLRKLCTSINDFKGRKKFPANWPDKLSHLELVVETDAGPLMISPTGQVIVPSSCPPFLLVNFITDHMTEASQKMEQYTRQKYEERDLHARCMAEFGLIALLKDDNVNPSRMIECLSRLLHRASEFSPLLQETSLTITTYYSVLSDGEVCIPWNWKDF